MQLMQNVFKGTIFSSQKHTRVDYSWSICYNLAIIRSEEIKGFLTTPAQTTNRHSVISNSHK